MDLDSRLDFANVARLLLGSIVVASAVGMTMRWAMVVDIGSAVDEFNASCGELSMQG